MIKLSIIIPVYNSEPYIDELMRSLMFQITKEVEVIVVDDGSTFPYVPGHPAVKLFRKENGGVSSARNLGLTKARGEYIVFIDSDDIVAEDYIQRIFKAIESNPDTVWLSWKSMDGRFGKALKSQNDKFGPYNRCVWNRVFKKTYIKGMKFDETMMVAEDDDFLNRLPEPKSHTYISKPIYLYRVGRKDGLSMRKANGEFDKADIVTQVVLYYSHVQQIGGVETFFYNFCERMIEYYDIAILYDRCDPIQINRFRRLVPCYHVSDFKIECDTLIMNGIFDEIPKKVTAKRKIRLVHTCRYDKFGICSVPNDCDENIFVSNAAMKSFGAEGKVFYNIPGKIEKRKALVLVSATRLTNEKGFDRMLKLATKFRQNDIPFLWLVFTAINNRVFPEGFVKLPPTLDIKPYIASADYLVQLSDVEAFCYSIQEALQLKVPVLTTPLDVLPELGVQNGKNGYILPFNMDELTDDDVQKIYNKKPKCDKFVDYSSQTIDQWIHLLGDSVPTHAYKFDETSVMIRCNVRFNDVVLGKRFMPGQMQTVDVERAKYLVEELKAWSYV